MKITVNFNNGEQAIVYGLSPLDFAQAIAAAYNSGQLDFQDAESVESAVSDYNKARIIS